MLSFVIVECPKESFVRNQKPTNWGSKGKEFEQLIAGALDFANDLQFEGGDTQSSLG